MINWIDCHRLDTPERVFYYENDFYPLSSFSAFQLRWKDITFMTLEHAYHWEKFEKCTFEGYTYSGRPKIQLSILKAISAHEAFQLSKFYKLERNPYWHNIRVDVMRNLMWAKTAQHDYVKFKLLATDGRELIEDSWRDDFWGWGPNQDGLNMHGKLWMEIYKRLNTTLDAI